MELMNDVGLFIQEILKREADAENELKRIRNYESQIAEMTSSIKDYTSKYEDSKLSLEKIKKEYAELEYQMNGLKNKCDIWKDINQRTTTAYNQDVKRLENLKETLQKNKTNFCNQAQDFIKNFGVAATEQKILYLNARKQISDITTLVKVDVSNSVEESKLDDLENMSVEQLEHLLKFVTFNISESENYFQYDSELESLRYRIKNVNKEILDLQQELITKNTNNKRMDDEFESHSYNNKFMLKNHKQQPITDFLKKCKEASGNIIINKSTYKIVEVLDGSNLEEKLVINEKTSHLIPCSTKDIETIKNKGSCVEEIMLSKPRFKMNKRKKGNFPSKIMYGRK